MTQFAYQSDTRFLKVPATDAALPYAVAGIAWDGSTTNRPGARFGPRAIRTASHMLCDGIGVFGDLAAKPPPRQRSVSKRSKSAS